MLVDRHGKIKALFFFFFSFVHLFYGMTNDIFFCCLTLFLCSCSYCILSYVYKTLKMPAHWCIYKLMFYIHLNKYLFYISEYKAMLIQLLIYHTYIYIYIYIYIYFIHVCVCVCVCVCVYIYIYIYVCK